jgi:hypothetical protein
VDLSHIALGSAGGFIDITTNGGASWTDIDLISVPGYQGFVTNVTWADNQTLDHSGGAGARLSARDQGNDCDAVLVSGNHAALQNGLPVCRSRASTSIRATRRTTQSTTQARRASIDTMAEQTGSRTPTDFRPFASTTSCRQMALPSSRHANEDLGVIATPVASTAFG